MMVHIYVTNVDADYHLRPIEDLADLVHPMAAVAWDRDCDELLLGKPLASVDEPLRFTTNCFGFMGLAFHAIALTDVIGSFKPVAVWDHNNIRWVSWRDRPRAEQLKYSDVT